MVGWWWGVFPLLARIFGGRFDESFPIYASFFSSFFLKWRSVRAHQLLSLGLNHSTVARRDETTVSEFSLASPRGLTFTCWGCHGLCLWTGPLVGSLTLRQFSPGWYRLNQPSLPTPFYSVFMSGSVFMALSTVFHSINYPDNSPLSPSVLPVLSLPYETIQLRISQ